MPQDVGMFAGIMFFNFPQALVKGQFVSIFLFHFLEDNVLALSGKNTIVFSVLEINDVVLNERIVLDFGHMELELPGHWVL